MANPENLSLFDYDPTSPDYDFRCGNNRFSDNIWDFNGYINVEHLKGGRLQLKFHFLETKPQMLKAVKWFIHYEMTTGKIQTAKRSLDGIIRFVKFVNEVSPEMESFSEISYDLLKSYFAHLLTAKSETTDEPLSGVSIKKSAFSVKEILLKGNIKGWDVPQDVRYVQRLYDEMITFNKALKKDKQQSEKEVISKIEDEELIDHIVKIAMDDLANNQNILTASSVVISTQLGLRISEIITMHTASIEEISGETMLIFSTGKLNAELERVSKPANSLVIYAVEKLQEHAKPLQNESHLPYLYLNRKRQTIGYPVELVAHPSWNKNFLRPWIKRHNIKDKKGKLVSFTSHTFRHAFASYALKGGASIEVISEIMNHKSIRGTLHYTHLFQKTIKDSFSKVLSEDAPIAGVKALEIKDKLRQYNPFKGKTTDQVDKLRRAMKIQVLSHGLCLHHPMRNEACAGDGVCLGCRNFITTPEFLDVHKGRLDKVQKELAVAPENGPYEAKLKTIENYLIGIIQDLETQMGYQGKEDKAEYITQET